MQEENENLYFSIDEVNQLKALNHKGVEKVLYHVWSNTARKDQIVEFIYALEIFTFEGISIMISMHDEFKQMVLTARDIEAEAAQLRKDFGDKVKLFTIDASKRPLIEPFINKPILNVDLEEDEPGLFSNALFILHTEGHSMKIELDQDGIALSKYEVSLD
jgi:hypothetical protein